MTETILPYELPRALDRAPCDVQVLSLDCFDTLLWRDCHAPVDVFGDLPGLQTGQRIVGETNARRAQRTMRARSEVDLAAIYAMAMPDAEGEERRRAVEAELDAEARACFAFAPTVELMRAAKAAGLKVVIVSDTYLDADQLQGLIRSAAGDEVADLIDRIFASSDAGISKSQGLLAKVQKALKVRADQIFHIGDNKLADYESARALGIPALHLLQFAEAARTRLRFERSVMQLIGDPAYGLRGLQPHRALLASEEPQVSDPAERLGISVLGPVFHAFDRWLRSEAKALQTQNGGQVHWLFMLRDGHLPLIVHEAGGAADSVAAVEISRFVATASSLKDRAAYERHYSLEYGLNPVTLARQMLFDDDEIARLVGDPKTDDEKRNASERLLSELRKGQRQKLTRRRARGYAKRLVEHVRNAVSPQPGDTLMLVDLGYNGSAQNRIDALLRDAFDVSVAGRYLLLREMDAPGLDKSGLIDARNFAPEMLEAMCANVAVIEQLATCALGSVVDYSAEGQPIRTQISVKGAQSEVRKKVQAGVVRFADRATEPPVIRRSDVHTERGWREGAAAALMRFMYLPDPAELSVLKSFEHDVNLGSDRMVAMFDSYHAGEGMRRRGLFYMKGSSRMFLPAELAGEDMNTRLSLLVQKRFGLGLSYADQAGSTISIPALYVGGEGHVSTKLEASPTHDGFYAVRIPLAPNAGAIALQIGAAMEWFELAGISSASVTSLKGGLSNDARPQRHAAQFDQIKQHAPGIMECVDASAFVLLDPVAGDGSNEPQMVEFVFRPLRRRSGGANGLTIDNSAPVNHPQLAKDNAA